MTATGLDRVSHRRFLVARHIAIDDEVPHSKLFGSIATKEPIACLLRSDSHYVLTCCVASEVGEVQVHVDPNDVRRQCLQLCKATRGLRISGKLIL